MDKVGNFLNSKYGWEFVVMPKITAGHSSFPIDMLRYDRCYPATQFDASEITKRTRTGYGTPSGTKNFGGNATAQVYENEIRLKTTKGTITPARWDSFGWAIKEAFELTKDGTPKALEINMKGVK